jgi:dihydrofolate reductase
MVKLIAIVDADFGIAKNGTIQWQFKDDLNFFRQQTLWDVIVMGWTTYFSIGKAPLPNRINCVISRRLHSRKLAQQSDPDSDSVVEVFQTPEQALEKYRDRDVWIIGGAMLFNYALKNGLIEQAIITQVHRSYGADLFIDESLLISNFTVRTIAHGQAQMAQCTVADDAGINAYSIYEYKREI